MKKSVNIAVTGAGGWGKNLIRTFYNLNGACLKKICDNNEETLKKSAALYPDVDTTLSFDEIINDPEIEAVVLATPAETHFALACAAVDKGKHLFTEKPLTLSPEDSEKLVEITNKSDKLLMVGHLLLFHPAVKMLKEIIDSGDLGEIYCIYSDRLNLGKVRKVENAWWSLAPHDISVFNYLLGSAPEKISAQGQCFIQDDVEDLVFATLNYPGKTIAQAHVSWLDPHKMRKLTIVGSKKMAVFDDMEAAEKIRIYDKGVVPVDTVVSYNDFFSVRSGDINIPHVKMEEPLKVECRHFIESILNNTTPLTDAYNGLNVVKALAAGQESMKNGGIPVVIT